MNRRDFFRARSRAAPLIHDHVTTLLRFSHAAMATVFELQLPWNTSHRCAEAAFAGIDRLESQLTVYRETSEVSRLNRIAASAAVPLEPALFNLLTLAARITQATNGAFDITAGPLVKAWGFFQREGRVPDDAELSAALANVGMSNLDFDSDRRTVRFLRQGVEINLGSIGKGYALDKVRDLLRRQFKITCGLLSGGNSSVLALGTPPNDPLGWPVGIRHPERPNERMAIVRLRDRAMATSGSTYQRIEYNSRKLGHVLDPRTGRPAEGMAMATAFASTAAEADALSTAFYVLGVEETRRFCERCSEVSALLLTDEPGAELQRINLQPGDVTPVSELIAAEETSWDLA